MLKISELTEMAADWKQIRPSTRKMWEITTRDIASFDAESFRRKDAIRVSGSMRKKYAAGTARSRIGYLGSIWKVGMTMELLEENVWTGLYEGLKKLKQPVQPNTAWVHLITIKFIKQIILKKYFLVDRNKELLSIVFLWRG